MDRTMNRMATICFLSVFLGLIMGSQGVSGAATPGEFYRGKTIKIVTNEPGGPPDLMSRTVAPFLEKKLGVRVIIETRRTDEVMNYVYATKKKRISTTLSITTNNTIIAKDILKAPGVKYEADKFNFIADIFRSVRLFQLSPKLPYKTLEALRNAKGLKGGGTSAKGSIAVTTSVMFELLGLDGKIITGFKGKKALTLAMARGEIDCFCTSDSTAARDEKNGLVVNFVTTGDQKSDAVPHVPTLSELGVKVPKRLATVHKFVTSGGMAVYMPPAVPRERIEYMRKTFQDLSNNKNLRNALKKLTRKTMHFVPGHTLQQEMTDMKSDKELAAKLDAIFKKFTAVR